MMQQAVSKHLVVLKQAGWWGDLYSHPNERGDSPAHGAVGLPTGSEAGLRRRQEWVAGDELEATPQRLQGGYSASASKRARMLDSTLASSGLRRCRSRGRSTATSPQSRARQDDHTIAEVCSFGDVVCDQQQCGAVPGCDRRQQILQPQPRQCIHCAEGLVQ